MAAQLYLKRGCHFYLHDTIHTDFQQKIFVDLSCVTTSLKNWAITLVIALSYGQSLRCLDISKDRK